MRAISAVLACMLTIAGIAFAQSPGFSLAAFERDPANYAVGRYPAGAAVRELRADLEAIGFDCRAAKDDEPGLAAACERIERTSRYCHSFHRVAIRTDGSAEIQRDPRCMGVIPAPEREGGE